MRRLLPIFICLLLSACSAKAGPTPAAAPVQTPAIADALTRDEDGLPVLSVYVLRDEETRRMDIETYVCGVLAGEMRSDWPREALRAQAILARTFVLRFMSEKTSRYAGADISTDIGEAQAYDADRVDDAIREAVESTTGEVLLTAGGALPYTWFHAHSGGMTALAREALDYAEAEPAWTTVQPGLDSADAPAEAAAWRAFFTWEEVRRACRDAGAEPGEGKTLTIGSTGPSGRAVTLLVGGREVNAARLRMALGSTVLRSTLFTDISSDEKGVTFSGRGYGHGVGMPQWGAYALAQDGAVGEDIALHYFDGLRVVTLWSRQP